MLITVKILHKVLIFNILCSFNDCLLIRSLSFSLLYLLWEIPIIFLKKILKQILKFQKIFHGRSLFSAKAVSGIL